MSGNAMGRGLLLAFVLLAGCSKQDGGGNSVAKDLKPEADTAAAPARMAYSYSYRFDVPAARIAEAEERHVALCDRLGPPRCRVLEVHRSTGSYGGGSHKLEVASGLARRFGAALATPIAALGGALTSSDITAEDVGRQIVDVSARMRAKEALVARLDALLTHRPGSTADLVATEKALADAQGELDAARSELALVQNRVDTSPLEIAYNRQPSFSGQIGDALEAVGSTVTSSVVALVYALAAAVPWAIVLALGVLLWRTVRRRLRERA